jgi:hypothetical protein
MGSMSVLQKRLHPRRVGLVKRTLSPQARNLKSAEAGCVCVAAPLRMLATNKLWQEVWVR